MSRRFLAAVVLAIALPAWPQQLPKLEPLPELPPPPPGVSSEQPGEPAVRIQPGGGDQVEEQLIDGRRVVRVTTPAGQEYYLVEDLGDGPGLKNESLDRGVRAGSAEEPKGQNGDGGPGLAQDWGRCVTPAGNGRRSVLSRHGARAHGALRASRQRTTGR